MDDLIRKQTVINMIDDMQFGNITHRLSQLHEAVRNYPSVDAVEVVRCRYCKHFAGDGMYCDNDILVHYDHFYCYYGEKEEDDE